MEWERERDEEAERARKTDIYTSFEFPRTSGDPNTDSVSTHFFGDRSSISALEYKTLY